MTAAVIFDYGRTLVSFSFPRQGLLDVLEGFRPAIAAALGRPAPAAEEIMRDVLEPLEEHLGDFGEDEVRYLDVYAAAWSRAGLDLPADLLYHVLDEEQRCWERAVVVAPGAFEILERLRARGVRTAIASNAPFPPEMIERQVGGNGLGPRVDAAVFSSAVGRRKPAPELYQAALDAVAVPAAEALYVGDQVREDYEGPTRLGMRAVICTALADQAPPAGVPTVARLEDVEALL